jgi:hypothetical protein
MPWEPDSHWQDIISVALVGTAQQALCIPVADGRLGQILAQIDPSNPESALLITAATLALYQQAGRLPERRSTKVVQPCPSDAQSNCSPAITRFLLRMLAGEYSLVLPEWLARVAEAGQCIPAPYLPDVLDLGRQQTGLRPAITAVLGTRGRWLAAQNPDWRYAVVIASDADWETSSPAARLLFFENLRSHMPEQARELLQTSWKQEAATDRAKFLSTFCQGLSLADEPFLEQVLGDRSQEVRRVAADLLASLPASRLSQRMLERLLAFVTLNSSGNGFEICLPDTCDSAMQQDGIELKPKAGKGERAEWLRQIIAATPLQFWLQLQPQGVANILEMAADSEWQDLLWAGWQQATQRQRDREWAIELLKALHRFMPTNLQALLTVLPVGEQQTVMLELLETQTDQERWWTAVTVLSQQPQIWSEPLSHVVIQRLEYYLAIDTSSNLWRMRELLNLISLRIAPHLLTEVSRLRDLAKDTPWDRPMHLLLGTLQFRQEMHRAFDASS